ncbi:hypothetical protein ZHAS_00013942 [Anopheles sinensis]|uniref:Uncharacterized protein n=1 Tax=Anopheles sinensis TaxID=74873 RepID=A0A084W6X5_ANOSI|nr:hypothetical protein ZHAS_00013942 [Anopheles sinensis]
MQSSTTRPTGRLLLHHVCSACLQFNVQQYTVLQPIISTVSNASPITLTNDAGDTRQLCLSGRFQTDALRFADRIPEMVRRDV